MRLLVVRHGVTLNNASGRATGQTDVGMSPLGTRQAEALAARLADISLDHIVTSDLRRASETAALIAARHPDVPLAKDSDLREIALGEWEGLTHAEVAARDPVRFAHWTAEPEHVAPPGGETYAELRERAVRALKRWGEVMPDGTVLWVTHGGVVGVLLCHVLGLDLRRRHQFRRDNASITELVVADSEMHIVRCNDIAHLEHLAADPLAEPTQVL